MDLSIIVPVYNAEKYLIECIESILELNIRNFELILINDCSTDMSGIICNSYAHKDSRVKVIHKDNGGAGAARNAGLEVARGKYILFCDADDYYNTIQLEQFYKDVYERLNDTILYGFDFRNVWPDRVEDSIKYQKIQVELEDKERCIEFLSSNMSHNIIGYALWNKLYSKRIIDDNTIRFKERNLLNNKDDWAEDMAFNIQYIMNVKGIEVTSSPIYYLRKHGMPNEQNERHLVGRVEHMTNMLGFENSTHNRWEVLIWHLKRYFYLDAQYLGVKELKREVDTIKYSQELKNWMACALQNWTEYGTRWEEKQSKDYKILLEYLLDGNLLKYRIKSKLLWRN